MNDNSDQFIQKCIKNWAAEQHAPLEIRSRVLHAASPFYLRIINGVRDPGNADISAAILSTYRSSINKRNDMYGRSQLCAWNLMTMSAPRFIA
jgi:hypothetical protein